MNEGIANEGAGKGDTYRSVDPKKYRENYDKIFGIKEDKEKEQAK